MLVAAQQGNFDVVKVLIKEKADLNKPTVRPPTRPVVDTDQK